MSKERLNEFWDKAMSAKTQSKREYWLDRYCQVKEKVYRVKKRLYRPIEEIIKEQRKCLQD